MAVPTPLRLLLLAAMASVTIAGCRLIAERFPEPAAADRFPDVLAVGLRPAGDRLYDVAVTLSSPYDTPQRYADGWRVLDPDGNVLAVHRLLHDHANEQPFTRTQRGVSIPSGIERITVEGRDLLNGFGGRTVTVEVDG